MKIEKNWINDVYTSLTDTLANDQHKITSGITKKTFNSGSKATAAGINTLINEIKGLRSNEFLGRYADCFTGNEALNTTTSGAKILDDTKEQIDNYVTKILQICGNKATSQVVFESGCTKYGDTYVHHPATGCTQCVDNLEEHPATGCPDRGNDFGYHPFSTRCGDRGNDYRAPVCAGNFAGCLNKSQKPCGRNTVFGGNEGTGCTNQGNKPAFNQHRNFTGETNQGNNFRAAFTTGCAKDGNDYRPAFGTGKTNHTDDFSEDVRTRADFNVKINGTPVANSNFI